MKNKQIIEKLYACAAACHHCADACLDESDIKKMVTCIRTDRDCAIICEATARLLAANSNHAKAMLNLCEKVCRQCAEECGTHEAKHCQDCAKACKECAEACAGY